MALPPIFWKKYAQFSEKGHFVILPYYLGPLNIYHFAHALVNKLKWFPSGLCKPLNYKFDILFRFSTQKRMTCISVASPKAAKFHIQKNFDFCIFEILTLLVN